MFRFSDLFDLKDKALCQMLNLKSWNNLARHQSSPWPEKVVLQLPWEMMILGFLGEEVGLENRWGWGQWKKINMSFIYKNNLIEKS